MNSFEVDGFLSFTLAIILLFIGKGMTSKLEFLRRYSIPEPVIGGFLCAAAVGAAYYLFNLQISFAMEVRDLLLLYFFAAVGLRADLRTLISACVVGGPIARYLITRNNITPSSDSQLDVGLEHDKLLTTKVDSYGVLWGWLWLNVTLVLGYFINEAMEAGGAKLPLFVSCLIAGILIGNVRNLILKRDEAYPGARLGIALISDISLGMFLTMALMGLQLWELQGTLLFIAVVMLFQILLSILFTIFIVFRTMGQDREASVISAGFGDIALGSTATAIVNMSAVAKQYGAAHRAFIIVPLVCGFFIDLVNALIINFLVSH